MLRSVLVLRIVEQNEVLETLASIALDSSSRGRDQV